MCSSWQLLEGGGRRDGANSPWTSSRLGHYVVVVASALPGGPAVQFQGRWRDLQFCSLATNVFVCAAGLADKAMF